MDDENDGNDESDVIRVEGTIDHFPSQAEALFYKDSSTRDEANPACGVPLFEKVPARLILESGGDDDIEGLDIGYASGASTFPAPGDWPGSFLGWVTDSEEDTLSVRATILKSTGASVLDVTRGEGMSAHLNLDELDPVRITYNDEATRAVANVTLEAGEDGGNVHYTCNDAREHEAWAGEKDKSSFNTLARANVHTALAEDTGFEIFDQRVETLEASLTALKHGVRLDAAPVSPATGENAAGLVAEGMTDDASLGSLFVNANLASPTQQERQDCRDQLSGDAGEVTPVHVDWRLPIEEGALVSFSTEPFLNNMPETDAWTRITDRCDARTLEVQVNGVNEVRFDQHGSSNIEASMSLEEPQSYVLRLFDYDEDGEEQDRRLNITEIPREYELRVETVPGPVDTPRIWMSGSEDIWVFSYLVNECYHVLLLDLDITDEAEIVMGRGSGLNMEARAELAKSVALKGICGALGGVQILMGFAGEVKVDISDGVRAAVAEAKVAGAWAKEAGEESIRLLFDVYGWTKMRDSPRFQAYAGTFEHLELEARDDEHDRGAGFNLTDLTDHGSVSLDTGVQWRENPGSTSPRTLVNGTLVPPSSMWEKECVKWEWDSGERDCVKLETNTQVAKRLADTFFHHRAGIFEDGGFGVPGEAWYEVLRRR